MCLIEDYLDKRNNPTEIEAGVTINPDDIIKNEGNCDVVYFHGFPETGLVDDIEGIIEITCHPLKRSRMILRSITARKMDLFRVL
jgi:hypothetical protein